MIVASTLKNLNGETLQRAQTLADKKVITSVLLKTTAQFVILGCPWILYVFISQIVVYILYEVFLSLHALLIFLIHCVLNQEVSHCIDRHPHIRYFRPIAVLTTLFTVFGLCGQIGRAYA